MTFKELVAAPEEELPSQEPMRTYVKKARMLAEAGARLMQHRESLRQQMAKAQQDLTETKGKIDVLEEMFNEAMGAATHQPLREVKESEEAHG